MGIQPLSFLRHGIRSKYPIFIRKQMHEFSTSSIRLKDEGGKDEGEVIIENLDGGKGLITLNRPKQLNTLNASMVCKIRKTMLCWCQDKYLVAIKGAGEKAFCAGGDVVTVTKDTTGNVGKKFFNEEYKLDALIASLNIPYIAFISGIVMGGGVGISVFGKFRVATETSMFAMPETQIGFFPDVGVSHILSRMPNNLGQFLALTGYRLKGYDLIHAGIATHFCTTENLKALEKELLHDFGSSCSTPPETILCKYNDKSLMCMEDGPPKFCLEPHLENINRWFGACSMEEIMSCVCEDESDPFAKETADSLSKMSPLSLKVTHRQIKEAAELDINECFNADYRIALKMLECGDFVEGVRALLIDKDKNPKWKHSDLSKVTEEEVDKFFAPLSSPEDELNLPNSMTDPCEE